MSTAFAGPTHALSTAPTASLTPAPDDARRAGRRLAGKTALVTGATTGIGRAAAALFLAEGARVAITGQDAGRLEDARTALAGIAGTTGAAGAAGAGAVHAVRADARSVADLAALPGLVEEAFGAPPDGGLDVLFVNAGVTWPGPLDAVDEAAFDGQVAINFKGPFFTVQRLLPLLRPGASVVLTTSCLDEMGLAGMSVYAATKAAVRSLARTLSAELVGRGVRVNAVAPGPTDTPIYGKLGMPPEDLAAFAGSVAAQVPMRRFGTADEIARAALFLASDDSGFMLGHELVVDGGWSAL